MSETSGTKIPIRPAGGAAQVEVADQARRIDERVAIQLVEPAGERLLAEQLSRLP